MHLKAERKNLARLAQVLAMLVLVASCTGKTRVLSLDEVIDADTDVPIHYLDTGCGYGALEAVYYYYDGDSSEGTLRTYFTTDNPDGQTVAVAFLFTCRYCGQLVGVDETRGPAPASITWARGDGVPAGWTRLASVVARLREVSTNRVCTGSAKKMASGINSTPSGRRRQP